MVLDDIQNFQIVTSSGMVIGMISTSYSHNSSDYIIDPVPTNW